MLKAGSVLNKNWRHIMKRIISDKQIVSIEQTGEIDLRRIQPDRYGEQDEVFFNTHDYHLPEYEQLQLFGEPTELELLLRRLLLTITFADSCFIQYEMRPGFIFDKGSVPRAFRSLVDNDELPIVLGAFPHDINFSAHYLSFAETNSLFYRMLRYYKMNRFRAAISWLAVSSHTGHKRWNANLARGNWTRQHVSVICSDPAVKF